MRHTFHLACALIGVALLVPSTSSRGQTTATPTRPPTVDDLLAFRLVSDPAPSPDGRWVAYVVTRGDREKNVNNAVVWIVPASGGTPVQLTRGPRTDRAPQWAPDGSWLAFLSDRSENKKAQAYGITPNGGEAWPVSAADGPVTSFRISPDGRRIAYIATPKSSKADDDLEKGARPPDRAR